MPLRNVLLTNTSGCYCVFSLILSIESHYVIPGGIVTLQFDNVLIFLAFTLRKSFFKVSPQRISVYIWLLAMLFRWSESYLNSDSNAVVYPLPDVSSAHLMRTIHSVVWHSLE